MCLNIISLRRRQQIIIVLTTSYQLVQKYNVKNAAKTNLNWGNYFVLWHHSGQQGALVGGNAQHQHAVKAEGALGALLPVVLVDGAAPAPPTADGAYDGVDVAACHRSGPSHRQPVGRRVADPIYGAVAVGHEVSATHSAVWVCRSASRHSVPEGSLDSIVNQWW